MVQFKELKYMTPDRLYVSAQVNDLPYYENVTLDSIIIDTEDTYCESGPSKNPPLVYKIADGAKSVSTLIDVSDICGGGTQMLFVWIKTNGIPYPEPPCGFDKEYTLQAVVDYEVIYNEAIKKLKCSTSGCGKANCTVDANFADFSLQYYRMETALKLGDWGSAYDAYCNLLRKRPSKRVIKSKPRKPCGCNG